MSDHRPLVLISDPVLARMEPTRWGSAIVCAVCLVTPVVVVRLQQTWEVLGG